MTPQEITDGEYRKLMSLSLFLFDEYKDKSTQLINSTSLNNILHDHDLNIVVADLSINNGIFVIGKFGESYTITIDQQLNDNNYLKFVYSFIISYISLNSNLIFYHYKLKPFEDIIFKHEDLFEKYYDAYIMSCIMLVPPYEQLAEIIRINMNKQNNTVDLESIANNLNIDINILRVSAKFYNLIAI